MKISPRGCLITAWRFYLSINNKLTDLQIEKRTNILSQMLCFYSTTGSNNNTKKIKRGQLDLHGFNVCLFLKLILHWI